VIPDVLLLLFDVAEGLLEALFAGRWKGWSRSQGGEWEQDGVCDQRLREAD
jgi:hypothetical protein